MNVSVSNCIIYWDKDIFRQCLYLTVIRKKICNNFYLEPCNPLFVLMTKTESKARRTWNLECHLTVWFLWFRDTCQEYLIGIPHYTTSKPHHISHLETSRLYILLSHNVSNSVPKLLPLFENPGLLQKFRRIGNKYNIRITFKLYNTLWWLLTHKTRQHYKKHCVFSVINITWNEYW